METRYSFRNFGWWCGDTVGIMEDRELGKYQFWIKSTNERSEWCSSPDEAWKDYNSKHKYPQWNKPEPLWTDWYGRSNPNV